MSGERPVGEVVQLHRPWSTEKSGSPRAAIAFEETTLVRRTLRSGQRVSCKGHIVILGDVNPGAEVEASGSIIVLGALRGVAHAGSEGDEGAVVAAFYLQPTQLRIARHITRSPDGDAEEPQNPEMARVRDGVVIIEPLHDKDQWRLF